MMLVPLRRKILRHRIFSGYRMEKQEGAWMKNVVDVMEYKI